MIEPATSHLQTLQPPLILDAKLGKMEPVLLAQPTGTSTATMFASLSLIFARVTTQLMDNASAAMLDMISSMESVNFLLQTLLLLQILDAVHGKLEIVLLALLDGSSIITESVLQSMTSV